MTFTATSTPSMLDIVRELAPLNRAVCSPGYDAAIDYLCGVMPFRVLEFDPAEDHNGWVVPPYWEVTRAHIRRDGEILYDGNAHPLGVIAQSTAFTGRVTREELRHHLYYDHRFPDSLPFHYRQQFRSWSRDWGFCVPQAFYDQLAPGDYDVVLETHEERRPLRMLDLRLAGTRPETIALCANLDHAGVANDGISGVAVAVEVFRRLARREQRFSYVLVLCQGIIGSEYYLGHPQATGVGSIFEALCLWMLGSRNTALALQESRGARSNVERALARALERGGAAHRRGAFEQILINDEYVWESHGIATASLSRYPYPEYHSSRDTIDIIGEQELSEAADVVEQALIALDSTRLVRKRFTGTVCLSNPRYDLYADAGQIALGDSQDHTRQAFRHLMDFIPSLSTPVTVASLALRFGLPEEDVERYLRRWEARGLVTLD
jgi:aminopeptidase-like protein